MNCVRLLLVGALCAHAGLARSEIVYVGPASDPDCTYHSVQEAVDAWAASSSTETLAVFIAHSQSHAQQAITIPTPAVPHTLVLRGDYPGCELGGALGRVTLDGAGGAAAPVIDILGTGTGEAGRFEVVLSRLVIAGGDFASGDGGGVRVRGNVTVTVLESVLRDNQAQRGGGLALLSTPEGKPHLSLMGNDLPGEIRDNDASQDGGGVYCNDASVYCDRYCLIGGNEAGGDGGGIGQQQCSTTLYPGRDSAPADPLVGLRGNRAGGSGGGAWVSGGSFSLRSNRFASAQVIDNHAEGDGGGLLYTGGASGGGQGVQFDLNSAGGNGGALASLGGGNLFFDPGQFGAKSCKDGLAYCSRFRDNSALGAGGAMHLQGSDLQLSNALIDGNAAANGSVLDQLSGGITFTNVQVSGNRDAAELFRTAGGYLDFRYATLTGNGNDDTAMIRFVGATQLTARNSILHEGDAGAVLASTPGSTFNVSCVLVHENASLTGLVGVSATVGDPQWDASGAYPLGVFVPGHAAPAVDACSAGPGSIPDMLGTSRPQDTPQPNGAGAFDMGAFERTPDPTVFRSGFESPA